MKAIQIRSFFERFREGKWHIDLSLAALVLCVTFPITPDFPVFENLQTDSGELTFKESGVRPVRLRVFVGDRKYGCDVGIFGSTAKCLESKQAMLVGKFSRVYWYSQNARFGNSYRVIMQMEVAEKAVLSYEQHTKYLESNYLADVLVSALGSALLLPLLRLMRRREIISKLPILLTSR